MSSSSLRTRLRAISGFRLLAMAMLVWPAVAFAETAPDAIAVNVDQAKLVKLPARVAIIVVTGKGYGATNFIAMDRGGEVLVDRVIQVEGPTDQLVTVYRGVDRE